MLRFGYIDYLNCLPVHLGLENNATPLELTFRRGVPTRVNAWFCNGEIDATAASSVVYARNPEKGIILPGACVAGDGPIGSILLFAKSPPWKLAGKRVAVSNSSATSVALLRILLEHHYRVRAELITLPPSLDDMLVGNDAALLIGDDALTAAAGSNLERVDLGEAWKEFTGEAFVYALWLLRRDFAAAHPRRAAAFARAVGEAREYSLLHREELLAEAARRSSLPKDTLEWYFSLLRHEFGPRERRGLSLFYRWLGLTPPLDVWEENP